MPLPWFRFYHEFSHDPKIQTLPIPWRFAFTMILCWHASGELSRLPDRVKAKIFEMTLDELEEMKATFTDLGFIENGWTPRNWEKRQRPSDSSAARVKAFKERRKAKNSEVTVTRPLANGELTVRVTEPLLISSSSTNASTIEEKDNTEGVTVTSPLANGYQANTNTVQPLYPDPQTTMHHIDTGPHAIDDETARDIWRRIWVTWKDESLCIGWYRWQSQYPPDVWIAAFSQTKEQYPGQKITIALVAKIAGNIAANGRKEAKPYAPDPGFNARPKTRREEKAEATARKLAELRARIGDDNDLEI